MKKIVLCVLLLLIYFIYGYADENTDRLNEINRKIALDPQNASLYHDRAIVYSRIGNYNAVLDDLSQAVRLVPSAENYTNRGYAYSYFKMYGEALADYTLAIQLSPQTGSVYGLRGVVYQELGYYQNALIDMSKAIELEPQVDSHFRNRGIFYMES